MWGWAFQILPYVDQVPLWEIPQGGAGDDFVAAAMVTLYFCPLVGSPRQNLSYAQGTPGTVPGNTPIRGEADYTANAGSWGALGNAAASANSLDGPIVGSVNASQGYAGSGVARSMVQITDGTSNTVLIGEKYQTFGAKVNECNTDQGYTDGWDNDMIVFSQGATNENPAFNQATGAFFAAIPATLPPTVGLSFPPQPWTTQSTNDTCGGFFGSCHTAGMPAAFCDGTVRIIPFSTSPAIWFSLCSINDGGEVTLPDT